MAKILLTTLCCLILSACSDDTKLEQDDKNLLILVDTITELDTIAEQVNIHDDHAILQSADMMPVKIIETVDSSEQTKKTYHFYDSSYGTYLEISNSVIKLGWWISDENNKTKQQAIKNIRTARKISGALLGQNGVNLVNYLFNDGTSKLKTINGVRIIDAACRRELCEIKVYR